MSRTQRLTVVLALNLALVAVLIAVSVTAHSLALLAESTDYLLDAAGVAVALLANRLASHPGSSVLRGGQPKATNVAALVNGGWLLTLEALVACGAAYRLVVGTPKVDGLAVLVVSGVAALVMAIGALILHGDTDGGEGGTERDLSVAAVLLDTAADAVAAAGVAIAGAIILAVHGLYWLDPAFALAIAIVVAYHALRLIRKVLARF